MVLPPSTPLSVAHTPGCAYCGHHHWTQDRPRERICGCVSLPVHVASLVECSGLPALLILLLTLIDVDSQGGACMVTACGCERMAGVIT